MQGQRNILGSFTETEDINQGSMANNAGSSQQTSSSNIVNPLESRLSSFVVSSGESSYANAMSHDVGNFTGWHFGEPSSRSNLQNQMNNDGKPEHGWTAFSSGFAGSSPSSEERRFGPSSSHYSGRVNIGSSSNQVTNGPLLSQSSNVNHLHPHVNLNSGLVGSSTEGHGLGSGVRPDPYRFSGLDRERISSETAVWNSSGNSGYMLENDGGSGSSLGNWGPSCKRKALEGTSGQCYDSGSSSSFPQSFLTDSRSSSSSSLSLSAPSTNPPCIGPSEQPNSRFGFGSRGGSSNASPSNASPSFGVSNYAESSHGNTGRRVSYGHQQESVPFNLPSTGSSRLSSLRLPQQQPRSAPYSESWNQVPSAVLGASSSGHQSQSHAMHAFEQSRSVHPWLMDPNSGVASSSNSLTSGDRGTALQEESNIRSVPRSNPDHSIYGSTMELRSWTQEASTWGLGSGNINNSDRLPSSTQVGPSSSVQPSTAWTAHPSPVLHSPRLLPEIAPWSLFPTLDSEPGGSHVGPVSSLPSVPSSSTGSAMSSGSNSQSRLQRHRRAAMLLERHSDDLLSTARSLRVLAAGLGGRQQLISEIRQVLNAMRRGENLRAEDFMLFDPFIFHGMAEVHDRHRDMRLDVDNMSYEELLELEERIGDVSTGLSEATITKCMKQRKFVLEQTKSPEEMEPCCICQEEYADGNDIGTLDCGHDFHTGCIKQWLMMKNLCPICKTAALAS